MSELHSFAWHLTCRVSVHSNRAPAALNKSSSSSWSSRVANEHVWEASCYWWQALKEISNKQCLCWVRKPTPCSFELFSQISSHPAVFFFHNKPTNSTFSHSKPAKRTGCYRTCSNKCTPYVLSVPIEPQPAARLYYLKIVSKTLVLHKRERIVSMSEVWVIASSSWSPKNRHEEQTLFRCFEVLKFYKISRYIESLDACIEH
jgi:hypothetical protein